MMPDEKLDHQNGHIAACVFEYNSPKPKTKNSEDRGCMSDCRIPMSNVLELQRARFHIDKCRRLLLETLADTFFEAFKPEYATESEICDLRSVSRAQLDAMSMQDTKAICAFLVKETFLEWFDAVV